MARKKILSVALASVLTVSTVFGSSPQLYQSLAVNAQTTSVDTEQDSTEQEIVSDAEQVDASNYGLCDYTKDGAILHAFCWSFNTIKTNMADIAEAGYTTVQTSPINECLAGEGGGMELWGNGKWYYHYQPTDWKIGNYQLGTREEYKAMCEEADKYGVKIISDVLPNHTTPTLNAVSQDLKNAAGGGGTGQLYHNSGFQEIGNYKDRRECTLGQMGGLPDVNTENQGFQKYYLEFCNDAIACGGDGFRYDTAKHIGVPSDPIDSSNSRGVNDFWDVATGKKSVDGVSLNKPDNFFIYGEVLQDDGIPYSEYASYMNMTASTYGYVLRDNNLKNNSLSTGSISDWCHSTPDKIVTWVESHDTYCNEHNSAWMNDFQIRAGWAVIAARANGTPLFFSRPDGSNGANGNYWGNNKIGAKGNDQFKHPEVAACNHFRNAMIGETEYLSNFGGNSCLVIERGTKGAVIINMGSQVSNVKLNKVADGTYTEEVSGKEVKVSGGVLDYTVPGGTIAVVYNPTAITKDPSVSASKDSGTFTEAFELTLTPSNATKATYTIDDGDTVEFTKATTIKIGADAQVGDKITVKVTAEGEGTPFSKTFTYTMAEVPEIPEYKVYVRTKKSDYSSAPTAYVYTGDGASATKLNGEWPGTAMTAEGDYYVYATNDVDNAMIIFSYDGGQDPAAEQPGYKVSGYMEYDKNSKAVTSFTPPTAKPKATATPKVTDAPKETDKPKETEAPTDKPTETTKVSSTTAPTKATTAPTDKPSITVSEEDGTSFSTETMDVKITLASGTKGSYSVDDGPEKSFTTSTTVTLGKGKIADTDVKLKVTASGETKTYTYKKDFDPEKAIVKTSAISKIKSLFEVVSEAASVDAASNSSLASQYGTNTVGIGVKKTISVDDSISDWDSSMLIAQGAANDDPRVYRPNSMFEVPIDTYALYAAYDDSNLYLMWEMTNVQDVVAPSDDYPLSQGVMYQTMNIPFFIAIDTGYSDTIGNNCATAAGGTLWDSGITIAGNVNRLIAISTNGANGPYVYSGDSSGLNTVEIYSKAGGGTSGAAKSGIEFGYGMGIVSSKVTGIDGAYGENNNRVVGDMCNESAAWVDFNTKGHSSATMDYHYEMSIPYAELGISASDVESNGLGVLVIATSGKSGMDCLPYDVAMNDQADLDDSAGSLENNSFEKSDEDAITTSFARVGNGTVTPGKTSTPKVTDAPKETEKVTATPKATEKATEAPKETEKATATPKATEKVTATEKPSSGTDYDGDFTVNFGADRSAPQYQTTELTLKAVPYGGSGDYTYEFQVDGTTIQKESDTDSCKWNGTVGEHTIKVIVKDGDGAKITCEKSYDLESASDSKETPKISSTPTATSAPSVDNSGAGDNPSGSATSQLSMTAGADKKAPQAAGTTIRLSIAAQGGTAPYKYTITVEGGVYGNTPNVLMSGSSSNSCQWTPTKAGNYKVNFVVEDSKGDIVSQSGGFKISTSVSISKFTANKYTVKKGKKVKFSMAATSTLSSSKNLQYKIAVLKAGSSSKKVIRKYAKSKSYSWKATKKGKYTVYLTVKDTKGNTKTVKLSKKITVK